MLLPEKIKGCHKIRDGAIVLFFKRDSLDFFELAEKFKLTERRIRQILETNHAFIKRDKVWEKEKRINRIERLIKEKGNTTTKDVVDLLVELRKEIEGDAPLVDNSTHLHFTNVNDAKLIDEARARGLNIPDAVARRIAAESGSKPA